MRLAADPETARWVDRMVGRPQDFDWDAGNRTKNRKHRVEAEDVEALFHRTIVLAGRLVEPAHEELRWLLLGQNEAGRRLALVFTRRGAKLRAISCRSMRRNERRLYEEAITAQEAPRE